MPTGFKNWDDKLVPSTVVEERRQALPLSLLSLHLTWIGFFTEVIYVKYFEHEDTAFRV